MKLYFLLFGAFILQEPISSNALLLEAYQYHYSIWIIHLLFVIATIFDTVVFYQLGVWFQKKYPENKIVHYVREKSESFMQFAGKNGERFALFVYGPIIFPLSAFIAPWLEINFWDALIYLFVGDVIFWYAPEWLVVLGVKTFIPNPQIALFAVLALASLVTFGVQYWRKKKTAPRG